MSEQDVFATDLSQQPTQSVQTAANERRINDEQVVDQLRSAGIKGSQTQLTDLARRLDYDEVAMQLLCAYLKRWYAGRLNGLDTLPTVTRSQPAEKLTLATILAAFENKLRGTSDLTLIYLLSLSDRPVVQVHLKNIFQSTLMERWLTRRDDYVRFLGPLGRLNEEHWHWVTENLRRLQLLEQPIAGQHDLLFVAEPIRHYFRSNLQQRSPDVYLQANTDMQKLSADTVVEFRQRYYSTPEIKTWISPELQAELNLQDSHDTTESASDPLKPVLWRTEELDSAQQQLQGLREALRNMKQQTDRLNQQLEPHPVEAPQKPSRTSEIGND